MLYPMSYQMYKSEHGLPLSAAERRAADARAGEIAAVLGELRIRTGRAFRLRRPVWPARGADPVRAIPREVRPFRSLG